MKRKTIFAAVLLPSVSLVAANGFENFTLSRNDFKSTSSSVITDFSSRTRTEEGMLLPSFSSKEPHSFVMRIR